MKLFAVVYSINGFSAKDSPTPAIAGIYTDEKIAEIVKKAAGSTAKITTITLDKVAPGYIDFAKQVLNIDLDKIIQEKKYGLQKMSDFDRECLMSAEDFLDDADSGCLISDDGSGYWATETMVSEVSCWADKPEWATHVCWYNK